MCDVFCCCIKVIYDFRYHHDILECFLVGNVDPVFEIIITPDYEGIVYDGVNISIMCQVIASNLLNYPVWTGPNGQQVLPQQPGKFYSSIVHKIIINLFESGYN